MNADQGLFVPLVLGVIEGLTEFLPVSSTGHLLLANHFFGFGQSPAFVVMIQLGAILAIVTIYFTRLWALLRGAVAGDGHTWHFIAGVGLASVPAALAGVLLHDFIQGVIYESPLTICIMLIAGGVVLWVVDRLTLTVRYTSIYDYPLLLCFGIGIFQMLALVPGVSRSGATIVGALLMGSDKRSAAEFTFFIALPIMAGAFGYDLYRSRDLITPDVGLDIAIGFAASFVVGAMVVRYLLNFVSSYGFAPFAYWRVAVGTLGLIGLWLLG